MMDAQNRLCWNSGTGQAVTTDAISENVINLAAADKEEGLAGLIVKILVKTAFGGMASGIGLELKDATAANLTTNARVLASIPAIAVADMSAGAMYQIPIPPRKLQQFLGLNFNLVNEAANAGNIIAWVDEAGESDVIS